jgi:hypothetical protein
MRRSALCVAALTLGFSGDVQAAEGGKSVIAGPYKVQPYVRPVLGATIFSDGTSTYPAASLGAEGGLIYAQDWKSKKQVVFIGVARLAGTYTLGGGVNGYDVRIGNFFGPWWKFIGADTGPDIFTNQYNYGSVFLDPVVGMDWPVMATAEAGPVRLRGGLVPTVFFSGNRPGVDWKAEPMFGFGHEFSYVAVVSLSISKLTLSVGYTHRITFYGPQRGFSLGIGF